MIFDVGAFRGDKTAGYLKEGHKVICFEPNPVYAEKLRQRFNSDVVVVQKAVGAQPGRTTLMICSKAPAISTVCETWRTGRFRHYPWDKKVAVDLITLDQAIDLYGVPDYIKIDAEGSEYQILQGLSRAVPCLSFEFAGEFRGATRNCLHRLKELGYEEFAVQLGKNGPLGPYLNELRLLATLYVMDAATWGDIYAKKESANESGRVGQALAR